MSRLSGAMQRFIDSAGGPDPTSEAAVLRRNMRINTMHGVFQIAAVNMVQPFLSIFVQKLGGTPMQVALLSSAPAMVSLLSMIPGAVLIDRQEKKKRMTSLFMLCHRVFFLALACIPLFAPSWRAWTLVTLVAAMNFPGAMSNTAWQSFISRIIPADRRAVAFADRSKFMNLFGTVIVLIVGRILDSMKFPVGYQVVFVMAFLMALVELRVFAMIDEDAATAFAKPQQAAAPVSKPSDRRSVSPALALKLKFGEMLSQPRFIRYTVASMLFYLAWQVPWPLFSLYQVKVLHANNTWVSILSLMNTGGALIGYGFWVKIMQKHGNLKTLFYSTVWIFIVPLVYAFSKSLLTVAIFNMLTGAIFSGVGLALFNALLESTPETSKTSYIAYYNTAVTISAILAPIIGVRLLNFMTYSWAFIVCAMLRLVGSFVFLVVAKAEEREKLPAAPAQSV